MTPKNPLREGRYNFRVGKRASHIASAGRLHIVRAACLPHHTPWTNVPQRRFVLRSDHSRTVRSVAELIQSQDSHRGRAHNGTYGRLGSIGLSLEDHVFIGV